MAGVPFNAQFAHIKQETDALRALIDQLAGPQPAAKAAPKATLKAAPAPHKAEPVKEPAPEEIQASEHEMGVEGAPPVQKHTGPAPLTKEKKAPSFTVKKSDVRRAVIMSEILSPPVSRRK